MNNIKKRTSIILSLTIIAFMFFSLFCSLSFGLEKQNARAEVMVSSYAELKEALKHADETTEIVVTQQINLPNTAEDEDTATGLDGKWATIRAVNPYIGEDGIVSSGEASGYDLFRINTGKTVTLKRMKIVGGRGYNGAIHNSGTLTMEDVTVTRSYRGLSNNGTAILKNCNIVRNICSYGGGILCQGGTIIMDGCSLSENYSNSNSNNGGGAMEIKSGGKLYANNTVIINNSSGEIGGAINCYGAHIWLMNCTISGNVTTDSRAYCGGGVGLNGNDQGSFYAVNTIIADNYQINGDTKVRSDIGLFSNIMNEFVNCIYGDYVKRNDSFEINIDNESCGCTQDKTSTFAANYRNDGVLIRNDAVTMDFAHPAAVTKTAGVPALYVPVKTGNLAAIGGIVTYFDYTDVENVKMAYKTDTIHALGGLDATELSDDDRVTTYYEGGNRPVEDADEKTIGASKDTNVNYHTVTLAKGYSNGYVSGATVYGDTYLDGTTITVRGNPDDGFGFKYWIVSDMNSTEFLSDDPYTFEVTKDIALIPVFVEEQSADVMPQKQNLPLWAIIVMAVLAMISLCLLVLLIISKLHAPIKEEIK